MLTGVAARHAGVILQLGHCPVLTQLTFEIWRSFRLQNWPPLEEQPLRLPSLAELDVYVESDAMGMFQLEHTIFSLMHSTSALWHKMWDDIDISEDETTRIFAAERCNN